MRVRLDAIAFDAGTQIRAALDPQVVTDYAEAMTAGATFPPIVLFHDGNQHYLADGFHRFMAAQRNQCREIEAEVQPGTKEDALWFGLGANRENGHRMTDADVRRAAQLAIETWPDRSDPKIASQIGCSDTTVWRVRQQVLQMKNLPSRTIGKDGKSYPASSGQRPSSVRKDYEIERRVLAGEPGPAIAAALGVSASAVARVRKTLGLPERVNLTAQKRRERLRELAAEGSSSHQIADAIGLTPETVRQIAREELIDLPADRVVGKSRHHDCNRIVEQMVMDAENLTADVNLIDFRSLDRDRIGEWADSLVQSRKALDVFIRRLLKEQQKHGEAA